MEKRDHVVQVVTGTNDDSTLAHILTKSDMVQKESKVNKDNPTKKTYPMTKEEVEKAILDARNPAMEINLDDVEDDQETTSAQTVESLKTMIELDDAVIVLGLEEKCDIAGILKHFENELYKRVRTKKTNEIRSLKDAKNLLIREEVNQMLIVRGGNFDLTGLIPFEMACIDCRGLGEKYKFYRDTKEEACKACDKDENGKSTGRKTISCPSCKGTGRHTRSQDGMNIDIECKHCHGEKTIVVKCRACMGTGKFKKTILDKIKSTTHCKTCKGRGFLQPHEQLNPRKVIHTSAPLTTNLGDVIKAATVVDTPMVLETAPDQNADTVTIDPVTIVDEQAPSVEVSE